MRWFKKKPQPFDKYFSIHIEAPPDPDDSKHFQFTVPSWYYGHLIYLGCLMDLPAVLPDPARFMLSWVTRGSNIIYQWYPYGTLKSGPVSNVMMWDSAGHSGTNIPDPAVQQFRLPSQLYLYPHDVINLKLTASGLNDTLTEFVLTFRIWEI